LGAGASYGVLDDHPATPPLGDALFAKLVARFPQTWGRLSDEQKRGFVAAGSRPAFEDGMRSLWDAEFSRPACSTPAVTVQALLTDMALYFATFRLPADGSNCYSRLIRSLARYDLIGRRVGIATLNYECLLEEAVSGCGIPVDLDPVNPHSGALSIWKPHGACNLLIDTVANGNLHNATMAATTHYAGGQGLRLVAVPPQQVASVYTGEVNIPPAMSLYAPGKHSPTAPELINALRNQWRRWASSADVVIVIGARFVANDTHIWDGLVRGHSSIWFVGDDDSACTLLHEVGVGRFTHLGHSFKAALSKLSTRLKARA